MIKQAIWSTLRATAVLAALAACSGVQPFVPDTARLPAGALGSGGDPDVAAANLAQWAFADSSRTYGRPIEATRAAASLDYLAGEITTSPRWQRIDPLTKEQLLQGRRDLRSVLGVAPGATSQQVVDSLAAASAALVADDRAAAERALDNPAFTQGGAHTLATLSNLPYIQMANVATQHLGNELFDSSTNDRF